MFPCLLPPNAVSISVGANRDTLGLLPRDGGCAALCCDRGGGPVHVCVSVHHRKTRPFFRFASSFLGQIFFHPETAFYSRTVPGAGVPAGATATEGMRGVSTTAVLALAAGCFAYPLTSSRQGAQEVKVCSGIAPQTTRWGIQPQSSFGGHCCSTCSEGKYVCCPTIDTVTGEVVSARPDPS